MPSKKSAPKFLNLILIKLPPSGLASIGHRVSGVVLFLSVPMISYLFGLSLENERGFQTAQELLRSTPLLLLSVLLVWSLGHHLLAGIRHLLLDIDIGVDKLHARASAWLVNIGAVLVTGLYVVSIV